MISSFEVVPDVLGDQTQSKTFYVWNILLTIFKSRKKIIKEKSKDTKGCTHNFDA